MTKQQFPDLIKAGLKVGDSVHSYLYGEGEVIEIFYNSSYPIVIRFEHRNESFTAFGFYEKHHLMPSITMHRWNTVAGEPFPFPKWEPKKDEAYAFWDDKGDWSKARKRFCVSIFKGKDGLRFIDENDMPWDNCAPIQEAMQIFGIKEGGHE